MIKSETFPASCSRSYLVEGKINAAVQNTFPVNVSKCSAHSTRWQPNLKKNRKCLAVLFLWRRSDCLISAADPVPAGRLQFPLSLYAAQRLVCLIVRARPLLKQEGCDVFSDCLLKDYSRDE